MQSWGDQDIADGVEMINARSPIDEESVILKSQVFLSLLYLLIRCSACIAVAHVHDTLMLVKLHLLAADNSQGHMYSKTRD